MTFYVIETDQIGLLRLRSSQELGLIKLVMNTTTAHQKPKSSQHLKEKTTKIFINVFTGLGCLEKLYHIEVDPNATPVVNAPRTIPAALRERVKAELDEMEKAKVISKVDEPTDWLSSMVVVEKPNGDLRIYLDPKR